MVPGPYIVEMPQLKRLPGLYNTWFSAVLNGEWQFRVNCPVLADLCRENAPK